MTDFLDIYDATRQIERFGFRIKDLGLLESALARPQTRLFGEDAYPTIELKCAAMMQSLIKNHSLFDGNKRTTWMLLNSFLLINDFELMMSTEQGFEFVLGMATDKYDLNEAAEVIREHLVQR